MQVVAAISRAAQTIYESVMNEPKGMMFVKKTLKTLIGAVFCMALMLSLAACGTNAASDKTSKETSSSSTEAVSSSTAEAASSSSSDAASSSSAESISSSSSEAVSASSGEAASANGKTVYFAAPLFNQGEKDYNLVLTKLLEDHGYQVFLPQRDGYLAAELTGKTEEELTEMIFDKVMKADICFVNLDGRAPDEGACVELGIAYANGKKCYAVKTDARSVEYGMDINPMITGCCTKVFKNLDGDKLIEELDQYLSENEL